MMFAQLCNCGARLFLGVPNTTTVSLERDCGYGLFKTAFHQNLVTLSADRMAAGKKVLFPPWLVGLFVFSGCNPETGIQGCLDALNFAFSCEKCLQAWELVGAMPLTCTCLKNSKVRREVGDASQEDANKDCYDRDAGGKYKILQPPASSWIYDGSLLRATLLKQKKKVAIGDISGC